MLREIKEGLYVGDLIIGGEKGEQVVNLKQKCITIFSEGDFELHKWYSN